MQFLFIHRFPLLIFFPPLIFVQILAEWEIPDEFWPPQIFTALKNGFQSVVYFTEKGPQFEAAQRQCLSRALQQFAEEQKMPMPMPTMETTRNGDESQRANLEGDDERRRHHEHWHWWPVGQQQQQHTVSANWHTIFGKLSEKNGTMDGCEALLYSTERMNFEIGTANLTIGCPSNGPFGWSAPIPSQINAFFCTNGTECQRAKTKMANCNIILMPESKWPKFDAQKSSLITASNASSLFCDGSPSPILVQLRPFEEKMPDLRASYYQRSGRFHCPSEVTCLYAIMFSPNWDGQNAMEVTTFAINCLIFIFLLLLSGCKIKLGH